jgi:hypothetical protein
MAAGDDGDGVVELVTEGALDLGDDTVVYALETICFLF